MFIKPILTKKLNIVNNNTKNIVNKKKTSYFKDKIQYNSNYQKLTN
jgi:hypothetical protein